MILLTNNFFANTCKFKSLYFIFATSMQTTMTVNTDKLFKISTYAAKKKVSITTILNKADKGELKLVLIDGVKFILEK